MVNIELGVNYRLLNLQDSTYLTISGRDDDPSTSNIISQEYINSSNQVWMFEASGIDKAYFIKSVENNQYVSVLNGEVVEGQSLRAYSAPFAWCVVNEPHMGIAARMTPTENTNLYIDIHYGFNPSHAIVDLKAKEDVENTQIWVLLKEQ